MSDIFKLDGALWFTTKEIGVPVYDFAFDKIFPVKRWYGGPPIVDVVARIGAAPYEALYNQNLTNGVRLIHDVDQHERCAEFTGWYGLITDLTPKSIVFKQRPTVEEVESAIDYPLFIKGTRQTNRHKKSRSFAESRSQLTEILRLSESDAVLHWQGTVCRELVPLKRVHDWKQDRIPASVEYRVFIWRNEIVGFGRYWFEAPAYEIDSDNERKAKSLALEVAIRIQVPFLVVDVAQREDGKWIVIECNDGQESGYAGCSPIALWQKVIQIERARATQSI